ncbi:MAG TPA: alkaline phosphatase family protein [Terriglobales bacterium]|nr:alkaline phosphatase family protein [Terriglobales bacterium]
MRSPRISILSKCLVHRALFVLPIFGSMLAIGRPAAACTLSTTNRTVTICTPGNNSQVVTPARVVAGATDSLTVTAMQIYIDSKLVYKVSGKAVDTFVNLTPGAHSLTVKGWDSSGSFSKNIKVAMSPPCALNPTNQTVTICTPGAGATVSLPTHLVAAANDSTPTKLMQVLIDGVSYKQVSSNTADLYLTGLAPGQHTVQVKAQDTAAVTFSSSVAINVTDNAGLSNLKHIIYLVQENRSFDSYLGRLGQYRVDRGFSNNVDGVPLGATLVANNGVAVHPFHYQSVCTEGLTPSWTESHIDVNGGLMDKFLQTGITSNIDPYNTRALGHYDWNDLPYLYSLAFNFGTSDRFFSPLLANTLPNRMYLFAGTSFGHIFSDQYPTGGWPQATIFDHLDQAGVSWRYYYQDNSTYLTQWAGYYSGNQHTKLFPISQYYTDLQNESTLPSVIFIERASSAGLDEHPGQNLQNGATRVAQIINALIGSPSWKSSAFILTFDEGGGLYDHVVPATIMKPDGIAPMIPSGTPPGDFAHTGFRIPLVVVSPWAKPHYVSHTWRDLTSILRLIETRFNVPALTVRDASADNMMEFFDFSTPQPVPTLLPPATGGTCDWNKEKAPGF